LLKQLKPKRRDKAHFMTDLGNKDNKLYRVSNESIILIYFGIKKAQNNFQNLTFATKKFKKIT
jgi:hypothetical protein